jgi:hypothetical protein
MMKWSYRSFKELKDLKGPKGGQKKVRRDGFYKSFNTRMLNSFVLEFQLVILKGHSFKMLNFISFPSEWYKY